jgi:Protein of unknown function (DUF3592)
MKTFDILLAAIFFTVVVLFLYSQFYAGYFVRFNYESTNGKIISSEVEQIEQEEECGEYCTETVQVFRPKFLYEYQVKEIKYFGTRYRAFPKGEDKFWAERIVKDFPAGKQVTVFYNPQNPERSVLTKETSPNYWRNFIFIIIFVVLSTLAFYRDNYSKNIKDKGEPYYEGFENLIKRSES